MNLFPKPAFSNDFLLPQESLDMNNDYYTDSF